MRLGVVIVDNKNEFGKIKIHIDKHLALLPEGTGGRIYQPNGIRSLSDYNKLLTSKEFWEAIPFDKVLITQMDAEMLRSGIEEFLEYDYVGAPWKFQQHGGNGGFSLRTKKAMLDVIKNNPYQGESVHGYEDVYFSNSLLFSDKWKLAPREVCKKFSCETIFEVETLGCHAIDKYFTNFDANLIRNQYKMRERLEE